MRFRWLACIRLGALLPIAPGLNQCAQAAPPAASLLAAKGQSVTVPVAAAEASVFDIALAAGQFIQLHFEQRDADLFAAVHGPNRSPLHRADWRWNGAETISWIAAEPGTYRLTIAAKRKRGEPGSLVLTVAELRPALDGDTRWTEAERAATEAKDIVDRGGRGPAVDSALARAMAAWEALGDPAGLAQTHNLRGFVINAAGQPLQALDCYRQALELRTNGHDAAGQAETLHNMAASQSATGEVRTARDLYLRAVALRKEGRDLEGLVATLANLGLAHLRLGDMDEAIETLSASVETAGRVGFGPAGLTARLNLGAAYETSGEPESALEQFQSLLEQHASELTPPLRAYALSNLGKLCVGMGDRARALPLLEAGVALLQKNGDKRGEGAALGNIAAAHLAEGRPAAADGPLRRALELARAIPDRLLEATTLELLSRAQRAAGDFAGARRNAEAALDLQRQTGFANGEGAALRSLGEIELRAANLDRAAELIGQARAVFARIHHPDGEADALLALARIDRQAGQPQRAASRLEEALRLIESRRSKVASGRMRTTYLAAKREYYDEFIDLLISLGRDSEALQASERSRARLLAESLPIARIGPGRNVDPALAARKRQLHRMINRLAQQSDQGRRVDALLAELDDVEARIIKANPGYAELTAVSALPDIGELQREIDAGTTLLELHFGATRSFAWVVTADKVRAVAGLPPRAEVEDLVRALHQAVANRAQPAFDSICAELSAKILGKVYPLLATKRLGILADGPAQYIPFAALPDPRRPKQPLVERHELFYLPSMSVIPALRRALAERRVRGPGGVAIVADPVYSASDPRVTNVGIAAAGEKEWPRLPHSRLEARAIAALLPSARTKVLLDFDARLEAITDASLHGFATHHYAVHGVVDAERPQLSALVLSLVDREGRRRDGYLRLHEIYNLNVPAGLVVLSACQTAVGREVRGEGLISLTRGFMYAGAPRLVASLWQVNDEATAELMKLFYGASLGAPSGGSPAAALRLAQIRMIGHPRWSHPIYWAAFGAHGLW